MVRSSCGKHGGCCVVLYLVYFITFVHLECVGAFTVVTNAILEMIKGDPTTGDDVAELLI